MLASARGSLDRRGPETVADHGLNGLAQGQWQAADEGSTSQAEADPWQIAPVRAEASETLLERPRTIEVTLL